MANDKLKWSSPLAQPYIEMMHAALLSGEWGDIFAPGYKKSNIDWKTFHCSEDDWPKKFSLKQFSENLDNWIKRQRKNEDRANDEVAQIIGHDEADEDYDEEIDLAQAESADHKMVKFPHVIAYYGNIEDSDEFATIMAMIPFGEYYTSIDGRIVVYEVVVDPTIYDPKMLMAVTSALNHIEWGSFVAKFGANGRLYFECELDRQYPERIRWRCEFEMPFDIEQNFVERCGLPSWFDWISPAGNRFLLTTVSKIRENHFVDNALNANRANHVAAPQSYGFSSGVVQTGVTVNGPMPNVPMPVPQGIQGSPAALTPQQSNSHGMKYFGSPMLSPQQMYAFGQTAQIGNHPSPFRQPVYQPQMPVQNFYPVQQTMPSGVPHNGHYPTAGVPTAAGMQNNQSMSYSDYTEETVEPAPPKMEPQGQLNGIKPPPKPAYKPPPKTSIKNNKNSEPSRLPTMRRSTRLNPVAEVAMESPTKKAVKKGYITQAYDYVTGKSSDTSSQESHMKQPKKYQATVSTVNSDSSASL